MISYNYNDNMVDCVENIESFYIFENGNKKTVTIHEKEFFLLKDKIEKLFETSRVMPAFGVSLHEETLNAMQKGTWLQINFSQEMSKNGLNFNSLLFKLEVTSGFNLIRLNNGKYEGRCIYLDFDDIFDLKQILNIS